MEEDKLLIDYVKVHGKGQWNKIANRTGLKRSGESCRLRWMNYLSPNVKKEEEDLIIRLHKLLGNRWSLIARNEFQNYWNSHLRKKLGIIDQNKTRIDFCQSSKQVKVCHVDEAATDPSPGHGTTTETTGITVDQSNQQEVINHRVLNNTTQESMTSESYINTFWIPDHDYELSSLGMIDHFHEYSSFHLS
ncbi:hypothetical protein CXB51_004032 [Gossypium anomalum]|uniref:Uncharacterized protein n=1 Tax=Gossypium anomalum TaxID=47600 RepID=A0A8J5ZGR9_9ROSI|nr:hypothetical protein CXB51_004032 [Gossypium anomalum]